MSARICGVGTSVPPGRYTQSQVLEELGIKDPKVKSLFLNSAIDARHLVLPPVIEGRRRPETQGALIQKHTEWGVRLAEEAIGDCLRASGRTADEIEFLCCVTSTGFLAPGLSALVIQRMGLRSSCARLDVVGMGCNAGLSALGPTASWCAAHSDSLAVLVCAEVCSAAYVSDGTMRSAVVNSLFGDGAAAVALSTAPSARGSVSPRLERFSTYLVPDSLEAMRYDWDSDQNLFSFFLDPDIPYVIGASAEVSLSSLFAGTDLSVGGVDHWLVHSGGKKVVDALRVNLGLSRHDLRHTLSVLRDYGNVSSGSFLFSLERLWNEDVVRLGDIGVMTTMGPGATIEMALVRWE